MHDQHALFDRVVSAYVHGDEEALGRLARQGVPVNVVIFLACEGGGRVFDDVGLMARIERSSF